MERSRKDRLRGGSPTTPEYKTALVQPTAALNTFAKCVGDHGNGGRGAAQTSPSSMLSAERAWSGAGQQ